MTSSGKNRSVLLLGLAAVALGVSSCGLVDPAPRREYVLVRVNGQPLPALLDSGTIIHYLPDGSSTVELYVLKCVSGTLLLSGTTFKLVTIGEHTFDGASRAGFPPTTNTDAGHYSGPDTLSIFEAQHSQFAARFAGDTSVSLTDITGWHNFEVLEFARAGPP